MEAEERIETLEKVVFLLLDVLRTQITLSDRLDNDDKQQLANFYDRMRGLGK